MRYIIGLIISTLLVYLGILFITFEPNPFDWGESVRFLAVLAWIMPSIASVLIANDMK